jgi:HK97 family phage major capsid protein
MIKRLRALQQRKAAAVETMKTITASTPDGQDLSAEQALQFAAAQADATAAQASIEQVQAAIDAERSLELPAGARIGNAAPVIESDPARGFSSLGEFAVKVKEAVLRPQAVDDRLLQMSAASATTYGNESSGADGGFPVPPVWRQQIMTVVMDDAELLPRCDVMPSESNNMTLPVDETTSHQTSGGILAYWDNEAAAMTQSKPSLKELSLKLNRVTALVPMTDELLQDASLMAAYVSRKAPQKIAFKVTDAIVNGNGVGMPLGILASPALVTVTKETSQAANTILAQNILKMMARMPARNFRNAVWIANQDILPQLGSLSTPIKNVAGSENVGGIPIQFDGPSTLTGPDYRLMGRPVVFTEAASALSSLGDIILGDLSQYLALVKSTGIESDTSMHLWFDQNLTAFRFRMRMTGQPWLSAPIARKNGSNTLSHFVTLQAR